MDLGRNEHLCELLRGAENPIVKEEQTTEEAIDITIAEILAVGIYSMYEPEIAVVKDTEGKTWIVTETFEDFGKLRGLVSRHDARPGMKLRLKIKKITHVICETETFQHAG